MGIDRHFADFLLCARDGGADFRQVDFRRVATLGRLNLFIDHRSLGAVFREHGADVTMVRKSRLSASATGSGSSFSIGST